METGLAKVFDQTTIRALAFYVDERIAAKEPDRYEQSLQKLFGSGAEVIVSKIKEEVLRAAGLEAEMLPTLSECVHKARDKFAANHK